MRCIALCITVKKSTVNSEPHIPYYIKKSCDKLLANMEKRVMQNNTSAPEPHTQKSKLSSLKLLLLLSLIPLIIGGLLGHFLVLSQPVGLEALGPGLLYIFLSIIGLPFYIAITIGGYTFLKKKRNLYKISRVYFIIPVVASIIGANFAFIYTGIMKSLAIALHEQRYEEFNPQVELVNQEIIANPYKQVNWNPAIYKYQLEITNNSQKSFPTVEVHTAFYKEGIGGDVQYVSLKPGTTTLTGEINISDHELICKELPYDTLYYCFRAGFEHKDPEAIDTGINIYQELELIKQKVLDSPNAPYLLKDCRNRP